MNIFNCQLGFGNEVSGQISFNVYISGCKNNKNCPMDKCHNPELRNFDNGYEWSTWKKFIKEQSEYSFFTCFCILGGEPLDANSEDLIQLLEYLQKFKLPIYLYTGYDYEQIIEHCYTYQSLLKGIYFGHYIEGSLEEHKELLLFEKQ